MRRWWLALLLAACGGNAEQQIYGEVHIHGFTGGSHPGALFLANPTPASLVDGDSILPLPPPAASAGGCTLDDGTCTGCKPPPPPVDAGAVHIRGGAGIGDLALVFQPGQHAYLAAAPIDRAIFSGGELLSIEGDGGIAPGFTGSLPAPTPIQLTEPRAPGLSDGDFEVAWIPGSASRVVAQLIASTTDGRWQLVTCIADDTAGRVTLPASLIARLPSPPRDVQLEVSRDQLAFARSAASGEGVVLHAGFALQLSWHEAAR